MGVRYCGGVFPCFVFMPCNACFCFPPINDSMSSRFFGFERYDFVGCPSFDGLAFLCCIFVMLDLQDEGSSNQTCVVCESPFHQSPIVILDPTSLEPINRSAG